MLSLRAPRGGLCVPLLMPSREYHPMKPKLSTKKSVKKRFALTPNGKVKYWPSQLSGHPRFVVPKGNFRHIVDLLQPSQGNRAKWGQPAVKKRDLVEVVMAARRRFLQVQGRELTKEEVDKLIEVVKKCRFVGNHVLPAVGTAPLSFAAAKT
jgi:ribosomal protein L35